MNTIKDYGQVQAGMADISELECVPPVYQGCRDRANILTAEILQQDREQRNNRNTELSQIVHN